MNMTRKTVLLSVLGVAILYLACASSRVSVDEAYSALRPLKQLELPEQVTDNFVVTVSNVADEGSSYKNHLELFVNDKMIEPNWAVSNLEDTYTYKLRLRPGYYKVKVFYYAYIGWGEEKFSILTHEEFIRVTSERRTLLKCNIAKEPNGEPVNEKMYFRVETEPLTPVGSIPPPLKPAFKAQPELPQKTIEPPKSAVTSAPVLATPAPNDVSTENAILLQINTVPDKANIIIDDKTVGQSPLRIMVDQSTDHIIQISADGYKTAIKYLDKSLMGKEKVFYLIQELETDNE